MKTAVLLLITILFPAVVKGQEVKKSPSVVSVNKNKIVPPKPLKIVPPKYPRDGYAKPPGIQVVVTIVISTEGKVTNATIKKTGGALFDTAALTAIKQWVFSPATHKGKPLSVKISIPFQFPPRIKIKAKPKDPNGVKKSGVEKDPKDSEQVNVVAKPKDPNGLKKPKEVKTPKDSKTQKDPAKNIHKKLVTKPVDRVEPDKSNLRKPEDGEIIVKGLLKRPKKAVVGEFKITKAILSAAPQPSAGDMLRTAPGFFVGHPQGEGVANALFLRGFNAEHGQDFELWAGDIPINLTGHIHAQGYADMHFIIPETVISLKVLEGVFNPVQGDFAVAGSGYFKYGVKKRGLHYGLTLGSFNSRRLLFMWAPKGQSRETFMAVSIKDSDGYGNGNRASQSISVQGRYAIALGEKTKLVLHVGGFGSRSILPGVLRLRDVEEGRVGFYDTYNDPTARSQSGFFSRFETSAKIEKRLTRKGEKLKFVFWYLRTNSRLRQNYTGYLLSFPDQPGLIGAGDLHQQVNFDEAMGVGLTYRSGKFKMFDFPVKTHTGITMRSDWIEQTEDLLFPAQNMIWRNTVDTGVQVLDLGFFADAGVAISPMFKFNVGFRADYLIFQVDDRLGNWMYSTPTNQSHQLGFKRDAMGMSTGPRISFELGPFYKYQVPEIFKGFSFVGSYGEGFRSPPPRSLQEGEKAPFTSVQSLETGIKWKFGKKLLIKATGFYTYLSDDYIYDPSTAMTKSIGDTSRLGAMAFISAKPVKGLIFAGSITYAYAVLEGSPQATTEEPNPGQKKGDLIPYIPPWVGRIDAGYVRKLFSFRSFPVNIRGGLGYSYLGPRPIPYSQWADPVNLTDMSLSLFWKNIELKLEATNVFGAKWHDTELNFVSQWDPSQPTRLPQRHVVAGAPRTVMLSVKVIH
jgi:iron complex outermembrane recepter protein